jgi:ketosteroid isomerase-like protein
MIRAAAALSFIFLVRGTPPPPPAGVGRPEFDALMTRLPEALSKQDTEGAVSCFTDDAVYMQPSDEQLYRGASELRPLFGALKPGTFMTFHHLAFDEDTQVGFGEFSFGNVGDKEADHGVAVVELRGGRIASWREYFHSGPASFDAFVATTGKNWRWTIRNYP